MRCDNIQEIGNGALTIQEQRTHFAAWAFMKSPILLGTDVRFRIIRCKPPTNMTKLSKLSSDQVAIVKNAELLAFHQDSTIGTPAMPYGTATTSPPELYAGKSSKGTHVFVINTGNSTASKTVTFSQVPGLGTGKFKVHDMWAGTDVGTFTNSYTVSLAAHDTAAILVTPA